MTTHSEHFADALSLYVGRHGIGVEAVSLMTGIPARTIYGIIRKEMRANVEHVMLLLKHLPEAFANMALAGTGLAAQRQETITPNRYETVASLLQTSGLCGTFIADGKICHVETAQLKRHLNDQLPAWIGFARTELEASRS